MAHLTITEGTLSASAGDALSLTYTAIVAALKHYLGYPATPTADQNAIIAAAIDSGLRRFYWPPTPEGQPDIEWNFLRKTGTVSLASGTSAYDLATDFGMLVGDPASSGGRVQRIGANEMANLNATNAATGPPRYCAVRPKTPSGATGSRYELIVRPTPTASGTLSYQYVCEPTTISLASPYPLGGAVHGETILAAILAAAEALVNDNSHVQEERFQKALVASVRIDQGAKHVVSR